MDGEIMYPIGEDGHIERLDPMHNDKQSVGIIVQIAILRRRCVAREAECADAGEKLYKAEDEVGELVRDDGAD